jgi:ATP/maltotriose-dependent transcriptional regulator MalT
VPPFRGSSPHLEVSGVRPRIAAALARASHRRVTLIGAPMGYGKTHALAAHGHGVHRIPDDAASLADVALAFAEATAPGAPGLHLAFAACARRAFASPEPWNVFASWLAEYARDRGPIAIDDVDAVLAIRGTAAFVAALVARSSEAVRWVFAGREIRQLPIARWLAEGTASVPIDENMLMLRPDELTAMLEERGVDPALLPNVEPRPATVVLACDLLATGLEPRHVADNARSLRALAEVAFADADAAERYALALAAQFDQLDDALLAALPIHDAAAVLAGTRARIPSAFAGLGPASWMRSAIRERITGDPRYDRIVADAVGALERDGRETRALRLALRAQELELAGDLVARHAERFLEAGVPAALVAALPALEVADDAAVLTMKAIADAHRGRNDTAEARFSAALERAEGPLRTTIVQRFAIELMRRGRLDAAELIERHLATSSESPAAAAPLRATLATAYAAAGRHADARRAIEAAFADAELVDVAARARMEHQRAYVALKRGDAGEADRCAARAIRFAGETGTYDVAARANTILYELAYDADEPLAALAALEGVAHYAALAGESPLRTFALLGAYDLRANDGDADAMRRIEEALADFDVVEAPDGALRALLPGRALALAWDGAFDAAFRLLAGTATGEHDVGLRAMRHAEIARYAAASGHDAAARDAMSIAEMELLLITDGARRDRIAASLALAAVLLGLPDDRVETLLRHGDAVERRTAVLRDVVRAYRARANNAIDAPAFVAILERARENGFGGFSRLVEALPRRPEPGTHLETAVGL